METNLNEVVSEVLEAQDDFRAADGNFQDAQSVFNIAVQGRQTARDRRKGAISALESILKQLKREV